MIPDEIKNKIEKEVNDIYRFEPDDWATQEERLMVANQSIAFGQGATYGYSLAEQRISELEIELDDTKKQLDARTYDYWEQDKDIQKLREGLEQIKKISDDTSTNLHLTQIWNLSTALLNSPE